MVKHSKGKGGVSVYNLLSVGWASSLKTTRLFFTISSNFMSTAKVTDFLNESDVMARFTNAFMKQLTGSSYKDVNQRSSSVRLTGWIELHVFRSWKFWELGSLLVWSRWLFEYLLSFLPSVIYSKTGKDEKFLPVATKTRLLVEKSDGESLSSRDFHSGLDTGCRSLALYVAETSVTNLGEYSK